MIIIIAVLLFLNAISLYACCVVSGKASRWEEERDEQTRDL